MGETDGKWGSGLGLEASGYHQGARPQPREPSIEYWKMPLVVTVQFFQRREEQGDLRLIVDISNLPVLPGRVDFSHIFLIVGSDGDGNAAAS